MTILPPSRALRRLAVSATAVVLAATGLVACSGGSGGAQQTAYATFSDVADMATGAPVELHDVAVGHVTSIRLVDDKARLTLQFRKDLALPAQLTARIRRTSVLGEKYVELRPDTTDRSAPRLADGAVITHTEVVPDFENLVASGTAVFGAVSSSELAGLISEGAQGFGGKGPELRALLDRLDTVTAGYRAHTDSIRTLITSLDDLSSTVGPSAKAQADAIANLAETTRILADQRDRLVDLLASLDSLAKQGKSILDAHYAEVDRQFQALRVLSQAIADREDDLGRFLHYLPLHNAATQTGVRDDFLQVLNDFVLCGVPTAVGGEDPKSPLNACTYVPQPESTK